MGSDWGVDIERIHHHLQELKYESKNEINIYDPRYAYLLHIHLPAMNSVFDTLQLWS